MIITKDFFKKASESLDLFKSTEVLADALDETPVGGENESDAQIDSEPSENNEESNEQNNELNVEDQDFSNNNTTDTDSSVDQSPQGEITLKPSENPYKAQNGKQLLDSMLQKLLDAVDNTLTTIHSKSDIETVVVSGFEDLREDVKLVRETVFILPKETSMYKYKLCVELYNELCSKLVDTITGDNKN